MKLKFIECLRLLVQTVLMHSYLKSVCEKIVNSSMFLSADGVRNHLKNLLGRLSLEELRRAHQLGAFINIDTLQVVVEVITKYKHRGDWHAAKILRDYEGK